MSPAHQKLIEECGELIQAICKLTDSPTSRKHFIEELADVRAALDHTIHTTLSEDEQLAYYRRADNKLLKRQKDSTA